MSKKSNNTGVYRSSDTGRFCDVRPKTGVVRPKSSSVKTSQVQRAVKDFYDKHGEAMTTLAYE